MVVWVCLLTLLLATVGNAAERTILYFGSAHCPPCRLVLPVVEQLQREGQVVRFIDLDKDSLTAERFQVQQTPTLIVLEDGRELDRIVGSLPESELRNRLVGNKRRPVPAKPRSSWSERSSVANPNSLLGPNHPLSRPRDLSDVKRRSRIDASATLSAGDVKRSMIGVNHPLYSRYNRPIPIPSVPASSSGASSGAATRSSIASTSVSVHPLLKGTDLLPAAPECMAATVRIRVDYGDSKSVGTGTVIHTFRDEGLVLTCGHLFHENDDQAPVTVEMFQDGKTFPFAAKVVDLRHDGLDLALIRFRSTISLTKVPLLPKGQVVHERDPVFSIGCDLGAEPSRRDTLISRLNRYLGSSNVEIAGAPVQGRSGGGLFDARGRLIGVCYAADNDLDEGLFVGPDAIYEQLQKFRLNFLFERAAQTLQDSDNQMK